MNLKNLDRRGLLGFAALAALGDVGDARAAEPPSVGSVRALNGRAEAEREAQLRILSQEGRLFTGDRVSTASGARAVLALGTATELRMGPAAKIRIDRFLVNAGGVINLESGGIFIDKDPRGSDPSLTLRSSHGLIAVRGTRFFAGPSNGVFGVFVERGSVAVSGGGREVVVGTGQGTDIARPGAAPTTPRVWARERIQAALDMVY